MGKKHKNRKKVLNKGNQKSENRIAYLRENSISWIDTALYGFIIIVTFLFARNIYQVTKLPKITFAELTIGLLSLFYLFQFFRSKELKIKKSYFITLISIFIGLNFISIFWAVNPYEALYSFGVLFYCYLFYLLVTHLMDSNHKIFRLFRILFYLSISIATIGYLQYFEILTWIPQNVVPAATFGNRNFAAQFMLLTIPLNPIFFKNYSNEKKLIYFLLLLYNIVFLGLTSAKGSWVGLMAATLFFVVVYVKIQGLKELKSVISQKIVLLPVITLIFLFISVSAYLHNTQMIIIENIRTVLIPL